LTLEDGTKDELNHGLCDRKKGKKEKEGLAVVPGGWFICNSNPDQRLLFDYNTLGISDFF
jgi:hypothetical protein